MQELTYSRKRIGKGFADLGAFYYWIHIKHTHNKRLFFPALLLIESKDVLWRRSPQHEFTSSWEPTGEIWVWACLNFHSWVFFSLDPDSATQVRHSLPFPLKICGGKKNGALASQLQTRSPCPPQGSLVVLRLLQSLCISMMFLLSHGGR